MLKSKVIRTAMASLHAIQSFRRPATPLSAARNFLFLQHHRALGAAVCAAPIFSVLKAALPDARIAVAGSGFSLDFLARHPAIERLEKSPDPRENLRGAARELRRYHFFSGEPYATILTLGNARGEFQVAAMLSGSRQILSYAMTAEPGRALAYDSQLSRTSNDLCFLDMLGHSEAKAEVLRREPELQEPQMSLSPDELEAGRALLRENGIADRTPFALLITQCRPYPVRSWPADRFRAIAEWLYSEYALPAVFVGAEWEVPAIEALRAPLATPSISLAGRTTIRTLAALMRLASVGFGLETGTMHVARTTTLPRVILAHGHGSPIEWIPLNNPRCPVLYHAYVPPGCSYPIAGQVSVEQVQHALAEVIQRYPLPGIAV